MRSELWILYSDLWPILIRTRRVVCDENVVGVMKTVKKVILYHISTSDCTWDLFLRSYLTWKSGGMEFLPLVKRGEKGPGVNLQEIFN